MEAIYSINGNAKAVESEDVSADMISKSKGVTAFYGQSELGAELYNLTNFVSESIFAEVRARSLIDSARLAAMTRQQLNGERDIRS